MALDAAVTSMAVRHSNRRLLIYCFIVGLGPILFGIDQGETTGFLAMPKYLEDFGYYDTTLGRFNMPANSQTTMYGAQLAFICIACAISGPIGVRYGRRTGLALCAIASITGPAVQAGVTCFVPMVIGRCIGGLGIGFAANFVVTYWSETAPVELRGSIVVMYQALINVAQFIGAAINQSTHNMTTRWSYRAPLLTQIAAPLLLLAFLFIVPETPRWFISRGEIDKASIALQALRGETYTKDELRDEIREMTAFIEIDQDLEASSSFGDCFRGTDRIRTRTVIMVLVCQQFTGISFIMAYGTYFFTIVGISNPFVITVITSVCAMAGSAAAFPLINHFGRRPILILGAAVSAVCMLTFATAGVVAPNSKAANRCLATFTSIYLFTYGATWGPVPQVVLGEIPSTRLRSKTIAIATTMGYLCSIFIICGMPYLLSDRYANLGTKVGFIFGGITVLTFFWTLLYLPETKGRTLECIDEIFLNRIPPRQFSSYATASYALNRAVKEQVKLESRGEVSKVEMQSA